MLTFQPSRSQKGYSRQRQQKIKWLLTHSLARRQEPNMGRVNHQYAASYLPLSSTVAGGAAEMASEKKMEKYAELSTTSCFCPIIMETFGSFIDLRLALLTELGRRMTECTGDARETQNLLQRISVTIQRFNAILYRSSFAAAS